MKKKNYFAPECTAYEVHATSLCMSRSEKEITVNATGSNVGLSNSFSGGLEDDTSINLWEEE